MKENKALPCLFPPTFRLVLLCHPWSLSQLGSHRWLGVVSRQPSNEHLIEIPLKPLLPGFLTETRVLVLPKDGDPTRYLPGP